LTLKEAVMHTEIFAINFRNMLLFQMLLVLTFVGNTAVFHRELLRIWKMLKTPVLPIRSTKTNHRSNKFWEIDMTKFEP
jgi:predicted LPLAT superfamily acyltransferase